MILIYAPYPQAGQIQDGWMGRIHVIDKIFKDRPRYYVFPGNPLYSGNPKDYRVAPAQVEEQAWMWWMDLRFSLHWRRLTELVEKCDFVYAHTCHSPQVMLPYYGTGKVITDIHGIAPEEEGLQGKPQQSQFFGALEETMIRQSAAFVTVTESMVDHYRAKYAGLDTPAIHLPIVDDHFAGMALSRPQRERPRVVYAGGTQTWQNIDAMFHVASQCADRYEFVFYSQDQAGMKAAAQRHGVAGKIEITSCTVDQLGEVYAQADFGFVLRDDIAVNRVACPTKLSEYLATGVIPIVKLAEIGDFARLGYRYLTTEDLIAGAGMDLAALNESRQQNRTVFDKIGAQHEAGKQALREMPNPEPRFDVHARRSLFMTAMERTMVFPAKGSELSYVRGGATHSVGLNDLAFPEREYEIELQGDGELTALSFFPMERPFVTTPMVVDVIDARGAEHRLAIRGNFRHDSFGNWLFDRGRPVVAAKRPAVQDAVRVRVRFEFVLYGPEAAMAERSRLGRALPG